MSKSVASIVAVVALTVVGLAGCGSSNSANNTTTTASNTATSAKSSATKPTITVPTAPAPTELQTKDITVGTGAEAKSGNTVSVQYVGANYSNGEQFDASWDRGQPFTFKLGQGSVIKGWDKGVAGMKVGGRRELIIPANMGYGAAGSPPVIAPNETLVFVVDLVAVK